MALPQHFSRDVSGRCIRLLKQYDALPAGQEDMGATLLLALAMPIIILPVERILRAQESWSTQGAEIVQDVGLKKSISSVFGEGKSFDATPFGKQQWRLLPCYKDKKLNVACEWPQDVIRKLAVEQACSDAKSEDAQRILDILRHALAHGGVAYLDKDGQNVEGEVEAFAFVATKKDSKRKSIGVSVLRVSLKEFREFLEAWVAWIEQSPIKNVLNSGSSDCSSE